MKCVPPYMSHTYQFIQVNDTGCGVSRLTGVCVSELGGDGGGLEEPGPASRLVRAVVVVIVVRLKVLLADEQLVDNAEGSVYVHVQGKQPLPQSLWVDHWKPMKGEVPAFGITAGVNATLVNHFFFFFNVQTFSVNGRVKTPQTNSPVGQQI